MSIDQCLIGTDIRLSSLVRSYRIFEVNDFQEKYSVFVHHLDYYWIGYVWGQALSCLNVFSEDWKITDICMCTSNLDNNVGCTCLLHLSQIVIHYILTLYTYWRFCIASENEEQTLKMAVKICSKMVPITKNCLLPTEKIIN